MSDRLSRQELANVRFLRTGLIACMVGWLVVMYFTLGWQGVVSCLFFGVLLAFFTVADWMLLKHKRAGKRTAS